MLLGYPVGLHDRSIGAGVRRAHQFGFDYVEVHMDYPWTEGGEALLKEARTALRDTGIRVGMHGPITAVADSYREVAEGSARMHWECLEIARSLDSEYYNFHISDGRSLNNLEELPREIANRTEKEVMERAREFTTDFAEGVLHAGIKPTLENGRRGAFSGRSPFLREARRVRGLSCCFDVGHTICASGVRTRAAASKEMERWVRALDPKLLVVHAHDVLLARGEEGKDHILIGEGGGVDFRRLAALLKRTPAEYLLEEAFEDKRGKRAPFAAHRRNAARMREFLKS